MNRLLVALALCILAPVAVANTPEEVVSSYLDALNSSEFSRATSLFATADCDEFKGMMEPLFSLEAASDQSELAELLFERPVSSEELQAIPPCEFVATTIAAVMRLTASMGSPVTDQASQILGSVRETESLIHYLVRGTAKFGDDAVSSLEVVSVRRDGDVWRIQMSEKMKGMSSIIQRALRR